jgi:fused signal recognition particle receptor
MLCGIARWGLQRGKPLPVYFIGVGEKLEDLQPFEAEAFAKALVG